MKKELFLITAYTPDNERGDLLRTLVNSVDRRIYDIMIVSHSNVPNDLIDKVEYFIYDHNNLVLTDSEYKYQMFADMGVFKVYSTEVRAFNHALAAWKLVVVGLNNAKIEGYEKVHSVEYDFELLQCGKEECEFSKNSKLLDNHSMVYYKTDYQPAIITVPMSFNLDKINKGWFEYNEDDHKRWLKTQSIKTLEALEINLISKEQNAISKSIKEYNKTLISNKYYSGGYDDWCVPVLHGNELVIFVWNKISNQNNIIDKKLINVKVIVNGDKLLTPINCHLKQWKTLVIGDFDQINTLNIIKNEEIINYDFKKINRNYFKKLNYIKDR